MNVVVFFILVYFLAFYKVIFCEIALFYVQKQKTRIKREKKDSTAFLRKMTKKLSLALTLLE